MKTYEFKHSLINAEKLDGFLYGVGLDTPVIIYGAGNNGRLVAQHLLRIGVTIKCFTDLNKDLHDDRPFFVDVVSPTRMKAEYDNESIIITPFIGGGEGTKELLELAGFPSDRIYPLEFDVHEFSIVLPDFDQHEPSDLEYAKEAPSNPPVTVFSLIFNTPEHYLRRAIESVLNQTFRDFVYFIIDHASNDGSTRRIISEYAALDKRIKVHRTECNFEIERQQGREHMQLKEELFRITDEHVVTDYVCSIDSDDFYFESFLETTYGLSSTKNIDSVYVQTMVYDEKNLDYHMPFYQILSKLITINDEREKWLAFCESRMPAAWWGGMVKSGVFKKACKEAWLEKGELVSDWNIAFLIMRNSKKVVLTSEVCHALTLRNNSVVAGVKTHSWTYMIKWFGWMINDYLACTRDAFVRLGVDGDKFAYPLAQYVMEFIFYIANGLTGKWERVELIDFYNQLATLLDDDYVTSFINSKKMYRESMLSIKSFFQSTSE